MSTMAGQNVAPIQVFTSREFDTNFKCSMVRDRVEETGLKRESEQRETRMTNVRSTVSARVNLNITN